jgi:hypothetical protein
MHPNGQIPAYEFAFSDVNPPVHAWAVWRVYKITGARGARDLRFLESVFQKLLMNFTWWVNRKDSSGAIFFRRLSRARQHRRLRPLQAAGRRQFLEQADGTAWMASYCLIMLSMAMELAQNDSPSTRTSRRSFSSISSPSPMRSTPFSAGGGLWDDEDGFYYDRISLR